MSTWLFVDRTVTMDTSITTNCDVANACISKGRVCYISRKDLEKIKYDIHKYIVYDCLAATMFFLFIWDENGHTNNQ